MTEDRYVPLNAQINLVTDYFKVTFLVCDRTLREFEYNDKYILIMYLQLIKYEEVVVYPCTGFSEFKCSPRNTAIKFQW